jgi:hypothetical protein
MDFTLSKPETSFARLSPISHVKVMFSFRGREKEETRRRKKKIRNIYSKRNLEPGGGRLKGKNGLLLWQITLHLSSWVVFFFFSKLTAFSGNLFALAFSSSGWKEKKTEKSRSSSRRNKEKNADLLCRHVFPYFSSGFKRRTEMVFSFHEEREKKREKETTKKKKMKIKERDLLPCRSVGRK